MSGSGEDGLKPLNPVDPVEGGVGQDLVHHLIKTTMIMMRMMRILIVMKMMATIIRSREELARISFTI